MPRTLSEAESTALLASFGVPCVEERVVAGPDEAAAAAAQLGFPVVAKLTGAALAHKTERGLVRLGLATSAAVAAAAAELLGAARPEDGEVRVLVAPMVHGGRELIVGAHRDPQFGACAMVGVGGVLAEAIADVAVRLVPLTAIDADEMLDDLAGQALFGGVRGEAPIDRAAVARVILAVARLVQERPDVVSVDVNPLVVDGRGAPVAVDALVELSG